MAAVTLDSWWADEQRPTASTNFPIQQWTTNLTPYTSWASGATIAAFFTGVIPQGSLFSTNGVKVRIQWNSSTATTGAAVWGAAYERFGVATVNSDNFGTEVTLASTVGGTVNIDTEADISIPYANMNSSVAGDPFRLRIRRVTGGSDTLVGPAFLFSVTMEQV